MGRLMALRDVKPDSPRTIVDVVEAQARATPDAVVFHYLDRTMTYGGLDAYADRIAHWARVAGIGRGDAVALVMDNRPEYVATWLGLLKVGAVVALINTNLRGSPLAHSIAIAGARHVIVGAELAQTYADAAPRTRALIDLGGAVRRRNESRLESRRREVHALREHRVKEAVEERGVALHDFAVGPRRRFPKVETEHAAHALRRERQGAARRGLRQTLAQARRRG